MNKKLERFIGVASALISAEWAWEKKCDICNEYNSLKSEIEGMMEKAKKWDMFEREDPDATIPIIENIDLRQQVKDLQEESKNDKQYIKVLEQGMDNFRETQQERDNLKEKIEKIRIFQDDLECGNNHLDEYPDFIKKEILGEKHD